MSVEFPAPLIERCYTKSEDAKFGKVSYEIVRAVLRESGHAELVAALVETLAVATRNETGDFADRARDALKKAGAL